MTFISCSDKRCVMSRILQLLTAVLLTGFISSSHAAKGVSFDDPWENVNRSVFGFNEWIDTYALKPVAKGYDTITPKPVQQLVSNFFSNLGEIRNAANSLLQLKAGDTLAAIGRFGINSTIGMLGILDVAGPLGIEKRYQDFGLTLARWDVPSGPFVVVPLLGPRTVRSGVGIIPDSMVSPKQMVEPQGDRLFVNGLDLVNTRAALLSSEELIVGDRYSFIRDAYLQRRNYIITGELPDDDF
ncbi:VacJ family lipoprotein [Endozoicomonas gorgoniicola]|uniref:VacJ family lipoprotein n=1 Tax=Endozoicomonas gorgoniicola TaxID=1234144 RepID=A0ABT3MW58_9GAMM|nr:VacJ family lipoprotein [Endozoicomonas gorgoniicola]MCW7553609.1 VacJ family lipoprotein [Endozoicomonas gorgoniicola]